MVLLGSGLAVDSTPHHQCLPGPTCPGPSLILLQYLLWLHPLTHWALAFLSPASLSLSPYERSTLTCRASQSKPGQAPRILIWGASTRAPGIPPQFRGSGSGTDSALTISSPKPGDLALCHSCQHGSGQPTVSHRETKSSGRPLVVFLLKPAASFLWWLLSFSIFAFLFLFSFFEILRF
uniref:Uncharacterized protein n=1 Tax=Prolemur simus TaxID=1328070 RepID=A0A8C9A1U2_PROSS